MVVIIGKLHFQQYFSHILIKFYWWRKPVYPKKTTDLPQATSTLLRISTPDQGLLLLPFRTFVPHAKTVTDLNWCHLPQATYKLNHKGCIEYTISGGKQLYLILCMLSLITMYYFFSISMQSIR
jgi:hypothetical protein